MSFAQTYRDLFLVVHLMGFAVGVGAATTMDVMFARFLLSLDSKNWHPELYTTATRLIWFALALITLSGVGLFLGDATRLLASSKFLVKMVVVLVVTVNGLLFGHHLAPRLASIFAQGETRQGLSAHLLRRLAFASGAVSLTSWYSAVVLGGLSSVPLTFLNLLGLYGSCLIAAVVGSLCVEYVFGHSFNRKMESATRAVAAALLDDIQTHDTLFSRPK